MFVTVFWPMDSTNFIFYNYTIKPLSRHCTVLLSKIKLLSRSGKLIFVNCGHKSIGVCVTMIYFQIFRASWKLQSCCIHKNIHLVCNYSPTPKLINFWKLGFLSLCFTTTYIWTYSGWFPKEGNVIFFLEIKIKVYRQI